MNHSFSILTIIAVSSMLLEITRFDLFLRADESGNWSKVTYGIKCTLSKCQHMVNL